MKEFFETFFSINLKDYHNIGWDLEINKVLLVFALLMCASVFVVYFRRHAIYLMVKQLIRHEAYGEDNAATVRALKLDGNRTLKLLLKSDSSSLRFVKRKGAVEYTYEEYTALMKQKKLPKEKIDFECAEFYLADGCEDRVKRITETYGTSLTRSVVLAIFTLIIYICVMLIMPELLTLINNLVGWIKGLF